MPLRFGLGATVGVSADVSGRVGSDSLLESAGVAGSALELVRVRVRDTSIYMVSIGTS